jgi:hypothetical protein
VPIHGPCGFVAAVAVAGRKFDLSVKTKPSIHIVTLYAFDRVRQLAAAKSEKSRPLTHREREVLAWSAQGKSAWEIGQILNLAKRTVDEHAKTGCASLAQGHGRRPWRSPFASGCSIFDPCGPDTTANAALVAGSARKRLGPQVTVHPNLD